MPISLKAARVNAKYKQKEVAKLININPSTLSSWENDHGVPDAIQLRKLCELYNVTMDDIFLTKKSILNWYLVHKTQHSKSLRKEMGWERSHS